VNYVFKDKPGAIVADVPMVRASAAKEHYLSPLEHTRTNSRRGAIDPDRRSYPPVEAVHRALEVLRAVNKLRIASVNAIHERTGINKSTIVRMLETLMTEGYVARDNLCGGYRLTSRVENLTSGYDGISKVIEVSRPLAIDLTRRIKWPIGLGIIDGDAIALQFWTGAISPWAHTNTVLGLRPDLQTSAMGRAYLAHCPPDELDEHLARFAKDPKREFGPDQEHRFRLLLDQARQEGYAARDPKTKPYRTTTLAMPIHEGDHVRAMISISFYKTAIPLHEIAQRIVTPLRATTLRIEEAFAFVNGGQGAHDAYDYDTDMGF
jgi:IclR family mhp operon transcriptional activator